MVATTSIYNVKDYGAVGDGKANDASAIQNAVNAASQAGGGMIFLPAGRYMTSTTITLPAVSRPNTNGTQGSNITIRGAGMYSAGIIYTGKDYAIYSDKEIAEALLLEDFYINHANGGGVNLPQGAHQMFSRFFSSACGDGKYGVYIQGNRSYTDAAAGLGSYVMSFRNCRFWSERGYNGTGVRIDNLFMCATFDNCFFSRAVKNYPHLSLYKCIGVHITDSAFERSEIQVTLPTDVANNPSLTTDQKEAARAKLSRDANNAITAPLIKIDQSHAISIHECHAEATYPAFVGITGNSTNVQIDGCRLDHYAISTYNEMKGYIVAVDPTSTGSREIIVGKRNYYNQTNHPDTTHGTVISDPVNAVIVKSFKDVTPFSGANYLTERRTVPMIGDSGTNILKNPSFYADQIANVPFGVEVLSGTFAFKQLTPSGCKISQSNVTVGNPFAIRTRTMELLNKYPVYTLFITGRNRTGKSVDMYVDIGGDGNDETIILPSGTQMFTFCVKIPSTATNIIQLVVYQKLELDLISMFVVPGITEEAPYGSELLSAGKLYLGAEIKYGLSMPTSGGAYGDLVLNQRPVLRKEIGWICTAPGTWVPFGTTGGDVRVVRYKTLPTADDSTRGVLAFLEGQNGLDDSLQICKKNGNNTYSWVKIN